MKAVTKNEYGSPEVLHLVEVAMPDVGPDDVLVRVCAASINPFEWHLMRGLPYLVRIGGGFRRPKRHNLGVDVAGVVSAVGANVKKFEAGDEVFGGRSGALAEYVLGQEKHFALKPSRLTFEQAAAITMAGTTALIGLRDSGHLVTGQRVLVNGAGGGVGSFSVQIAKAMGATVTGVCSRGKLEMVRSLGADSVIDYASQDFTKLGIRYDLIVDTVGNRSLSDFRRALTPKGTLVMIGGGGGRLLGPLGQLLRGMLLTRFVSQRLVPCFAKLSPERLAELAALVDSGQVTPYVGRTFPLEQIREAMTYFEEGHVLGKTVLVI
jgi:NADPH:quinone reductase-like Zn-dependent oxidoreductase